MRKKLLTLAVVVAAFVVGTLAAAQQVPKGSDTFSDVPEGHYADEAIGWAAAHGIVKGVSDTEFNPDGLVTRAQTVVILRRGLALVEGPTTTTTVPLTGEWPTAEVLDCYIIDGVLGGGHAIIKWRFTAPSPVKRVNVYLELRRDDGRIVSFTQDTKNWNLGFSGTRTFEDRWWVGNQEIEWSTCHAIVETVRWQPPD